MSAIASALSRLLAASLALAGLAACNDGGVTHRSLSPIPSETVALMEQVGVTKESPTLIRAYKKEAEFEVWKMREDGKYTLLKTYPMCRWSGQLGPKTREGDRQAPEGFYSINPGQLNPNSAYYLSFNVGYPNAVDRSLGRSGGAIMVHGACSSAGCFSMTDKQIAEIYAIARTSLNAGQKAVQMQSFPFRMTAENMAKHRLDPNIGFWKNLKEGADYFEVTKEEPRVAACGRRYVFGAQNDNLDAASPCPSLRYEPQTRARVAQKSSADEAKVAELAASGVKAVRLVYQDGGQHPDFYAKFAEVSRPEAIAPPEEIALDDKASRKSVTKLAAKAPAIDAAVIADRGAPPAKAATAARARPQALAKLEKRDAGDASSGAPVPPKDVKQSKKPQDRLLRQALHDPATADKR